MFDPSSVVWRCTVQKKDGSFCDQRSMPDVPFPICKHHADKLFQHLEGESRFIVDRAEDIPSLKHLAFVKRNVEEYESQQARRRKRLLDQSQVYYVRIHDHVKIGYSTNIKQRMGALRVPVENLLATEPGGRDLEAIRHEQFAAERVGRLEDFNPSRRLLAHIEAIKAEHGEPKVTTYRSGAA